MKILLWRLIALFGSKLMAFASLEERAQMDELLPPETITLSASPLGMDGMTVNGRIQPHGTPTRYWFEYGLEANYSKTSRSETLPPMNAAFYRETWDRNLAGWSGGMSGKDLKYNASENGFVRYSEPSGDDPNHVDGIGTLHLPAGVYSANFTRTERAPLRLGGGDPDLRDATVELKVRGNDFSANGSKLVWWTQSDIDIEQQLTDHLWRRANWAYTGFTLTDALHSGDWEVVKFRLKHNSEDWTYGGNNHTQPRFTRYAYDSIDNSQRHLNTNFIFALAFVNPDMPPTGSIDFTELTIRYRNYSLVFPGNGGKLLSAPVGGESDVANLTDGWRTGPDKMWKSGLNPKTGQEFIYQSAHPADISAVHLHQHAEWPSKDVEVSTSTDGIHWQTLIREDMAENSPQGPNFSFLNAQNISRRANFIKVFIRSGYRSEHWGLGEIEVFGRDAILGVDDDWYNVNLDIVGLEPGQQYFYRLVAESSVGRRYGTGQIFETPDSPLPQVETREAKRLAADSATLTGRLTPMGRETTYYFEYGVDATYGQRTAPMYGGRQETPRLVIAHIDGLKPDSRYHYRLVATNSEGTASSSDAVFHTASQ